MLVGAVGMGMDVDESMRFVVKKLSASEQWTELFAVDRAAPKLLMLLLTLQELLPCRKANG